MQEFAHASSVRLFQTKRTTRPVRDGYHSIFTVSRQLCPNGSKRARRLSLRNKGLSLPRFVEVVDHGGVELQTELRWPWVAPGWLYRKALGVHEV